MALCTDQGCDVHLSCRYRRGHGGVLPSATPTRTRDRKQKRRPIKQPSWEAGVAGEHRRDGSFMPFLSNDGESRSPMGVHEFATKRHDVEAQVKRLKTDPTVFSPKGT